MIHISVAPLKDQKGLIGRQGPIGIQGYPGIYGPVYDEDLIRFCLNFALNEGQILRFWITLVGEYHYLIDLRLDKSQIERTTQIETILLHVIDPLIEDVMRNIPGSEIENIQVIIKIRIFQEAGKRRYHSRAKVKDGKTYIRKGMLLG